MLCAPRMLFVIIFTVPSNDFLRGEFRAKRGDLLFLRSLRDYISFRLGVAPPQVPPRVDRRTASVDRSYYCSFFFPSSWLCRYRFEPFCHVKRCASCPFLFNNYHGCLSICNHSRSRWFRWSFSTPFCCTFPALAVRLRSYHLHIRFIPSNRRSTVNI